MIDRVAARLGRRLYEVPVGFKWFVDGLLDGSLGFGGEESAGARSCAATARSGRPTRTASSPALLAAEITARAGRDPGELYRELAREFGDPVDDRVDAPATPQQKKQLAALSPQRRSSAPSSPARRSSGILDQRAGQRRADRRRQGDRRERLVRRAAVGHRGHLQDLRGELPRRGSSAPHPGGSAGDRRCRACGGKARTLSSVSARKPRKGPRLSIPDPSKRGAPRRIWRKSWLWTHRQAAMP